MSTINTPPPFDALQLVNVVEPAMERVEEEETTAEMAPPLLDAEEELNEHPVMVSVTLEESATEIAPPFPSLHEQLLNVIPDRVTFEESDPNSNIVPLPSERVMFSNVLFVKE